MDYGLWGNCVTLFIPYRPRGFNVDSVTQLHDKYELCTLAGTPTAGPRPCRPDWPVDELCPIFFLTFSQSVS